MADVSSITGYGIHSPFSNYGGYAGTSSTTSGVGGVGEYHHRHRNEAGAPQDSQGASGVSNAQSSDLLDVFDSTSQAGGNSAVSQAFGIDLALLTGISSSTRAASPAGTTATGASWDTPGRFFDALA